MCKFCEDHDDIFESPLLYKKVKQGFGGKEHIWVYINKDKLCMHIFNQGSGKMIDREMQCSYCPGCGRRLSR